MSSSPPTRRCCLKQKHRILGVGAVVQSTAFSSGPGSQSSGPSTNPSREAARRRGAKADRGGPGGAQSHTDGRRKKNNNNKKRPSKPSHADASGAFRGGGAEFRGHLSAIWQLPPALKPPALPCVSAAPGCLGGEFCGLLSGGSRLPGGFCLLPVLFYYHEPSRLQESRRERQGEREAEAESGRQGERSGRRKRKVSNSDVRWKQILTASNLVVSSRETFEQETSSDLSGLVPRQY